MRLRDPFGCEISDYAPNFKCVKFLEKHGFKILSTKIVKKIGEKTS